MHICASISRALDPVLKGYTTAAAFLIGASQLGKFFQIDVDSDVSCIWLPSVKGVVSYFPCVGLYLYEREYLPQPTFMQASFTQVLTQSFDHLGDTNGYAVMVGVLSMAMIWGSQKYIASKPNLKSLGIPIHLLIMVFWIIITYSASMNDAPCNLSIVGKIPAGLPKVGAPAFKHIVRVFPHSIGITFVSFMLNLSLLKVFSATHNYEAEVSQNLGAAGLANVIGSFFGSYPGCPSLSRAALVASIGV